MRVLLVYDTERWRRCYQAHDLKRYGPVGVSVTAMPTARLPLDLQSCFDVILQFPWTQLRTIPGLRCGLVLDEEDCLHEPGNKWFMRDTPSFLRNRRGATQLLPQADFVIAVNSRLHEFGKTLCPETYYCPVGVDTDVFQAVDEVPLHREKLRVGWCGQPEDKGDLTGRKRILDPVMARCREFCDFSLNCRTAADPLDRQAMRNWYNSLDLFLCTAIAAGTPVAVLEAMACGRTVIAPRVGDLPDILTDGYQGQLVAAGANKTSTAQAVDQICEHLRDFAQDRQRLQWMGGRARKDAVKSRDWSQLASRWINCIVGI